MKVIELKNVTKSFGNGHTKVEALKETNFSAMKGEFIAIIGPSGSGKTTFLTILGSLQAPTTGEIYMDGQEISQLKEKEQSKIRFKRVGFILQGANLIPFLTVAQQLKLVDKIDHASKKMDQEQLFKLLDLTKVTSNYPNKLSGGEKQRAAIARALYNDPDIILADEPTASLDTERAFKVVELLSTIAHEYNKTVIMITHDTRLIGATDKVYEMIDGNLRIQDDKFRENK